MAFGDDDFEDDFEKNIDELKSSTKQSKIGEEPMQKLVTHAGGQNLSTTFQDLEKEQFDHLNYEKKMIRYEALLGFMGTAIRERLEDNMSLESEISRVVKHPGYRVEEWINKSYWCKLFLKMRDKEQNLLKTVANMSWQVKYLLMMNEKLKEVLENRKSESEAALKYEERRKLLIEQEKRRESERSHELKLEEMRLESQRSMNENLLKYALGKPTNGEEVKEETKKPDEIKLKTDEKEVLIRKELTKFLNENEDKNISDTCNSVVESMKGRNQETDYATVKNILKKMEEEGLVSYEKEGLSKIVKFVGD